MPTGGPIEHKRSASSTPERRVVNPLHDVFTEAWPVFATVRGKDHDKVSNGNVLYLALVGA
jgi:hypothetical protein